MKFGVFFLGEDSPAMTRTRQFSENLEKFLPGVCGNVATGQVNLVEARLCQLFHAGIITTASKLCQTFW